MTRAGRAGAAGAGLLVLALAACTTPSAGAPPPPSPAPVGPSWPGCVAVGAFTEPSASSGARPSTGAVPPGFTPTTAVLCARGERTSATGETATVALERTATEIGPLLTYLARPSEPPADGPCTADAWIPPWLFLVDDSRRYVAPAIPVDGCGKPLDWYVDRARVAWLALPYTDRVVHEGG